MIPTVKKSVETTDWIKRSVNVNELLPVKRNETLIKERVEGDSLIITVERSVLVDKAIPLPAGEELQEDDVSYGVLTRTTTKER